MSKQDRTGKPDYGIHSDGEYQITQDLRGIARQSLAMISDEAVEAAAKAQYEFRSSGFHAWEDLSEHEKSEAIAAQQFALEAAAPYLLADAWESSYGLGYADCKVGAAPTRTNPYRSQS